ncbi:MAG: hypothetical protein V1765_00360 [bacterium]
MKSLLFLIILSCTVASTCFSQPSYREPIPYKMMELEFNTAGFKETPGLSTDPLTILIRANIKLGYGNSRWCLRADLTGSSSFGAYATIGPSYKNNLAKDWLYRAHLGAGYLIGKKQPYCADISLLLVHSLAEVNYLLAEVQTKSNGRDFWYLARINWQVLGAIGLGFRAQTNSLLGACVQLGHENFSFMWFGVGVKEDELKKSCIAYGVKVIF